MKLTAQLVDPGNGSGGVMGIGRTSAAAVQLGEAVGAFLVGVDIAAFKLIADGCIGDSVIDITQKELLLTDKLMAWI